MSSSYTGYKYPGFRYLGYREAFEKFVAFQKPPAKISRCHLGNPSAVQPEPWAPAGFDSEARRYLRIPDAVTHVVLYMQHTHDIEGSITLYYRALSPTDLLIGTENDAT